MVGTGGETCSFDAGEGGAGKDWEGLRVADEAGEEDDTETGREALEFER